MKSIYSEVEKSFVFTKDMNDKLVNRLSRQMFGVESKPNFQDISEIRKKPYTEKIISVQQVPGKKSGKYFRTID